jgi:hypothetical protein
MNNLSAERLNQNMQKRVGWNFGDLSRLTMAQAGAMLETVDRKLAATKTTSKLHESQKNSAYNGMVLAKQVLEAFISEAADSPYAVGMAQAMKSTGDKPPLKKTTIKKAHKIAKSVAKNESVNEAYSPVEQMVDDTFTRMLSRLNAMTKMTRSDGALAKNIQAIGGDPAYLKDTQQAIDDAYDAVEEAHYGALGHIVDESAKQGMFEDEVGAAETLMAAQDMVDSIQGMLEDVGEMINEKLPPLTDSIRRSGGAEAAADFNQQTNSALNALMDAVRAARESMAGAVGTLSGEAPTPMGGEQDFDLDTAEPADEPAGDDEDFDLDDFEASDAAAGGAEPLGRAKRA